MNISYYAIFQYDDDGICISFPDIPPCLTCAENENEGLKMAKEALDLYLHRLKINELPTTKFDNSFRLEYNQKAVKIEVEMESKEGQLFSKNEVIEFDYL